MHRQQQQQKKKKKKKEADAHARVDGSRPKVVHGHMPRSKICLTVTYQPSESDADKHNFKSHPTHTYTHLHTHTQTHTHPLQVTHLEVSVYHPHLMAVEHGLQDLLDAMTARKQQGEQVSLSTFSNAPDCHIHAEAATHTHTHTHTLQPTHTV